MGKYKPLKNEIFLKMKCPVCNNNIKCSTDKENLYATCLKCAEEGIVSIYPIIDSMIWN